jgi:carbonic anhydrase
MARQKGCTASEPRAPSFPGCLNEVRAPPDEHSTVHKAGLRFKALRDAIDRERAMKTVDFTYRYEVQDLPIKPRPSDSDAALRRLHDGNRTFSGLLRGLAEQGGPSQCVVHVDAHELGLLPGDPRVPRQRPFAAILGCSDARVPVELLFGEGPNDLFVVRVAGNGLGTEVLGSLNYAVEHLGGSLKLIVVLGHSGCGAIATAVDVFLSPSRYLPLAAQHALRNVLDRLLVVVQASAKQLAAAFGPDVVCRPGYRDALIESAVVTNAALAAYSISHELEGGNPADLKAVYGVYLLETHDVWTPHPTRPAGAGLAVPPRDQAGFLALSGAIVRSTRIANLLEPSRQAERP